VRERSPVRAALEAELSSIDAAADNKHQIPLRPAIPAAPVQTIPSPTATERDSISKSPLIGLLVDYDWTVAAFGENADNS
jgi:hypothetical protein